MSESLRVEGVEVNVDALFSMSIDFTHLRITIKAIVDALNKSNARAEEMEKQIKTQAAEMQKVNDNVKAQNDKLAQQASSLESQGKLIDNLFKTSEAQANKVKAVEQDLKALHDLNLPRAIKNHEERIDALEKENKGLKDQIAKELAKAAADAAQAAADAAAAAAAAGAAEAASTTKKPTVVDGMTLTMSEEPLTPVVVTSPITVTKPSPAIGQNFQLLETKINQIATDIGGLTGRVSMIENSRAVPTATHIHHASSELDPQLVENLTAQEAQTQKQLMATLAELKQVQAALHALEKTVGDKASIAQLDTKADKKDVSDAIGKLNGQGDTIKSLDRELASIRDQLTALQNMDRMLNAKLSALLDAATCGLCKENKPTVKCAKCNLSFCDKCDEQTHGPTCSPEMQAHLRAPLQPLFQTLTSLPVGSGAAAAAAAAAASASIGNGRGNPTELDELRRWAEDQFNMLARKEKATRGDIHDIFNQEKDLKGKLDALLKTQGEDKKLFEELVASIKKLETELNNKIANGIATGRNYTDNRIEELLLKLRELERALEKGMKSELKRFERDVLVFMETQGSHDHSTGGDASVGKIHFRCLSCDQHVSNLQGPSSLLYNKAVGMAMPVNSAATNMNIEKGKELYLNGRDGAVYRGREATNVTIIPATPDRPAQFNVHYADRTNHATTNPRGSAVHDQKTIPVDSSPSTIASAGGFLPTPRVSRPASAPYPEDNLLAPGSARSLPPTRPATRNGLRSARPGSRAQALRGGEEEQKTPLREQLQAVQS